MKLSRTLFKSAPIALLVNFLLVYAAYEICRFAFIFENWGVFKASFTLPRLTDILHGGLYFDTSAILYTNALYALLILLPLPFKENRIYQKVAKWYFVVINSFAISLNLSDCVYYQFTGRRTTCTFFAEFSNENNLGSILGIEVLRHWYLFLLGFAIFYAFWKCYITPKSEKGLHAKELLVHTVCLALFIPLCIGGMRGGFTKAVRPITISNANQYADHPYEAAAVLNTPFSFIRTTGKATFVVPDYYSPRELDAFYSPVHIPRGDSLKRKNVVVLIVESFGREYIGGFNKALEGGKYKGYTPFVDSLMQHSMTFRYSFCNGRKSIDGMPSVLSSIPMFVEPFFLTPSSMNDISGLAGELTKTGYYSAFFHGAENGSMGFEAFARKTGFKDYFGRTEFNKDKRFNGDADFDGTWAIWDEPFMQFYALKMSEFKQPFVSAIFTASSHHPFVIPEKYKDKYPEEGLPIHKCIRYTDNALRQFFNTAKQQPWFENTIFVLTSDHTNESDHDYYKTDLGLFCSPIIFYDPSGQLPIGEQDAIAQQIDIMPTMLNYMGYSSSYVAFGIDLFNTPADKTWAVNYNNGIYQYIKGTYMLQFDGTNTKAVYNFRTDSLLQNNLKGKCPQQAEMEREIKAIIQSYMVRMTHNELVYSPTK